MHGGMPLGVRVVGDRPQPRALSSWRPIRWPGPTRSVPRRSRTAGGRVWIEKVKLRTSAVRDQDEDAFADGPVAELLRYLHELRAMNAAGGTGGRTGRTCAASCPTSCCAARGAGFRRSGMPAALAGRNPAVGDQPACGRSRNRENPAFGPVGLRAVHRPDAGAGRRPVRAASGAGTERGGQEYHAPGAASMVVRDSRTTARTTSCTRTRNSASADCWSKTPRASVWSSSAAKGGATPCAVRTTHSWSIRLGWKRCSAASTKTPSRSGSASITPSCAKAARRSSRQRRVGRDAVRRRRRDRRRAARPEAVGSRNAGSVQTRRLEPPHQRRVSR
jgi:hypothetical protein